jgi:hypothetical protein
MLLFISKSSRENMLQLTKKISTRQQRRQETHDTAKPATVSNTLACNQPAIHLMQPQDYQRDTKNFINNTYLLSRTQTF